MELVFGYLAGLLTLVNPCVLPVLPIVIVGSLQASKWGPIALAAGMSVTFVVFGLTVAAFGTALGITDQTIANVGAVLMIVFGLILLIPQLSDRFSTLTSGFAARADEHLDQVDRTGLRGQFVGGMLLGAVWSPCIGPTLGGAIALASGGGSLIWAGAIMVSFAMGVSTLILVLGYGARKSLQGWMRALASKARPLMGIIFILVGAAILFKLHHVVEIWAIQNMPIWLQDLSVRY